MSWTLLVKPAATFVVSMKQQHVFPHSTRGLGISPWRNISNILSSGFVAPGPTRNESLTLFRDAYTHTTIASDCYHALAGYPRRDAAAAAYTLCVCCTPMHLLYVTSLSPHTTSMQAYIHALHTSRRLREHYHLPLFFCAVSSFLRYILLCTFSDFFISCILLGLFCYHFFFIQQ